MAKIAKIRAAPKVSVEAPFFVAVVVPVGGILVPVGGGALVPVGVAVPVAAQARAGNLVQVPVVYNA